MVEPLLAPTSRQVTGQNALRDRSSEHPVPQFGALPTHDGLPAKVVRSPTPHNLPGRDLSIVADVTEQLHPADGGRAGRRIVVLSMWAAERQGVG